MIFIGMLPVLLPFVTIPIAAGMLFLAWWLPPVAFSICMTLFPTLAVVFLAMTSSSAVQTLWSASPCLAVVSIIAVRGLRLQRAGSEPAPNARWILATVIGLAGSYLGAMVLLYAEAPPTGAQDWPQFLRWSQLVALPASLVGGLAGFAISVAKGRSG